MHTNSLFDLTGKKALVTGGGKGIGRGCAEALAMAGADVAIVGRDRDTGERTADRIRELGRDSVFVQCDVSQPAQVQSMVKAVVTKFGRLDIAVNNAGIFRQGVDEAYAQEDWDSVIATNLTGVWSCACAEMRQMVSQTPTEGKIINIGSIGARIACSNGAYDASKAGVVHLTKTLAARWGRYNINVNSLSPGYVISSFDRPADQRARLREITPLGYVQRLDDLHGSIVFLAAKASDYITGQDLLVDGGHTLSPWIEPLDRSVPPRVDPAGEMAGLQIVSASSAEHE